MMLHQKINLDFIIKGIPSHLHNSESDGFINLVSECFPITPRNATADSPAVILGYLAPKLVGLFLKKIDKDLEKEIGKYSTTHSKSKWISPYKKADKTLILNSACFRYTRFTDTKHISKVSSQNKNKKQKHVSTREIDFDLIGQWAIQDQQFLKIRPLRIYMKKPSVPNDSSLVSLAISAKIDGVWREDNQGHSREIFQSIFLKEKIKKPPYLKKEPTQNQKEQGWTKGLHYYKPVDKNTWSNLPALPIIPYSNGMPFNTALAKLEIKVAEVGNGKRKQSLKFTRKLLKFFNDDLTSLLEEAAKGIFVPEQPPVDDTKYFCATFIKTTDETGGVVDQLQWNDTGDSCPVPNVE